MKKNHGVLKRAGQIPNGLLQGHSETLSPHLCEFRKRKAECLANNIANSTHFWKDLKSMGCGNKTFFRNNIKADDWVNHFKQVFQGNRDASIVYQYKDIDLHEQVEHMLNKEISEEEIKRAVNKLKLGKTSGIDGIIAEMLKNGGEEVNSFLIKLFNTIFDKGIYPQVWAKAIIVPIFKKGDTENVDNYRGIS